MKTYRVRPKKVSGAAVRPPGSKSITNRALAAAALADGTSVLRNPLRSDDTEAMTECLRAMGVEVTEEGADAAVRGTARLRGGGRLPARASGTTARFITALAVLADGPGVIDGTARLRRRPSARWWKPWPPWEAGWNGPNTRRCMCGEADCPAVPPPSMFPCPASS